MNKIFAIFAEDDPAAGLVSLALERTKKEEGALPQLEFFSPERFASQFGTAKTADALLIGNFPGADELGRATAKALNLHTSIRVDGKLALVTNNFGGIYGEGDRHGFDRNAAFGRAAYDAEYFCELEIERTARVAYELAEREDRGVLLSDGGNGLLTSAMWRKIVSDINEDYPSVPVKMCDTREFLRSDRNANDVLLASRLFGDAVWAAMRADGYEAFVGDSNVALYSKIDEQNAVPALAHMLRSCFALEKGARKLKDVLASLPPNPSAEETKAALLNAMPA